MLEENGETTRPVALGADEDDKKMLAELQKSCGAKAKDWELRKAARAEELVALQAGAIHSDGGLARRDWGAGAEGGAGGGVGGLGGPSKHG